MRANGTKTIAAIAAVCESCVTVGSLRRRWSAVMPRKGTEAMARSGYRKFFSRTNAGTSDQRLRIMKLYPAIAAYFPALLAPAHRNATKEINAAMMRTSLMGGIVLLVPRNSNRFRPGVPAGGTDRHC